MNTLLHTPSHYFPEGHAAYEAQASLPPLAEQLAAVQHALAPYPVRETYEERAAQDKLAPTQEAAFTAKADDIFDSLGILRAEAALPYSRSADLGTSGAIVRLRGAADVASAALEFGYDRDAPEDELRAATGRLVEALRQLRARALRDSAFKESRERTDRQQALTLLTESGLRELGRRNNLGDDLTPRNLRALQEKTGLGIVESALHSMVFSAVIPPRSSSRPTGRHHHGQAPVYTTARPATLSEVHDYYYIPELAGPNVPRHPALGSGWVPGRIGHFALHPRYTGGRLPR